MLPTLPGLPIQPPTDHPYRFLAIAGLSGALLSGAAILYASIELRDANAETSRAQAAYAQRVDALQAQARRVIGVGTRADSQLVVALAGQAASDAPPNYGIRLRQFAQPMSSTGFRPSASQAKQLLVVALDFDSAQSVLNRAAASQAKGGSNLEVAGNLGEKLFVGSLVTMVFGMVFWIGRGQRYQDHIAKVEATRALDSIGAIVPWDLDWKLRLKYGRSQFLGKPPSADVTSAAEAAAKARAERVKQLSPAPSTPAIPPSGTP